MTTESKLHTDEVEKLPLDDAEIPFEWNAPSVHKHRLFLFHPRKFDLQRNPPRVDDKCASCKQKLVVPPVSTVQFTFGCLRCKFYLHAACVPNLVMSTSAAQIRQAAQFCLVRLDARQIPEALRIADDRIEHNNVLLHMLGLNLPLPAGVCDIVLAYADAVRFTVDDPSTGHSGRPPSLTLRDPDTGRSLRFAHDGAVKTPMTVAAFRITVAAALSVPSNAVEFVVPRWQDTTCCFFGVPVDRL